MEEHALEAVHDLRHLAELVDQAMFDGAAQAVQGMLALLRHEAGHRLTVLIASTGS